jgi:hypothetical protein
MLNDQGDIEIGPINMGQTMAVAANMVAATVYTFVRPEDSEDEKAKLSWVCLAAFLHQLVMPSKRPDLAIGILGVLIEALKDKHGITGDSPRVVDDDKDQITVTLNGKELRGWSYASDDERRQKMLQAREYVEGWCDGRDA